MNHYGIRLAFLATIICCIAGCAGLPHTSPLPDGATLRRISSADPGTPFSLQKADGILALSDRSLKILDLKTGTSRTLTQERPIALALSPDEERIAAAFPKNEKDSLVRLYDAAGKPVGETTVEGKVTAMAWRGEAEVVIAALRINRFSFGAHLNSLLYRWDGVAHPVPAEVNDTTVRPYLAKMPEEAILKSFSMALSPYGDEVILTKLKDPPNFTPFMQIFTHHLDSGGEHQVGEAAMGSGGPVYAPDGEKMLVGNAGATTRWVPLGGGKEIAAYPWSGTSIALSPSGTYALVDGHLFRKEQEIASFPPETAGAFSRDGRVLVLSYRDGLYLLSGLDDSPAPPVKKDRRLLELRRLRSRGLISQEELEKAKGM